jgi:hypothetical protein
MLRTANDAGEHRVSYSEYFAELFGASERCRCSHRSALYKARGVHKREGKVALSLDTTFGIYKPYIDTTTVRIFSFSFSQILSIFVSVLAINIYFFPTYFISNTEVSAGVSPFMQAMH